MESRRLIAFATGTRADYGIARWILQDIKDSESLALKLIVTGSHLSGDSDRSVEEILRDGFTVDRQVPVDLSEDSPQGAARWMSACLEGLTTALVEFKPNILLIVGDRFEALIAAQAAALAGVPVAHVHGGEVTQGSLDEGMRHAITKLAHVHFAATSVYGRRILQLGEDPKNVHVVGSPGLCAIDRDMPVRDDEIGKVLGFSPTEPFALVTYHPSTAEELGESQAGLVAMVEALTDFPALRVVITGTNFDPNFSNHADILRSFAKRHPHRVTIVESLGHRWYLAALRRAQVCIGNSSSGIIEAPALGVPTINIGTRQGGRLRASSILDVPTDAASISRALARALDANTRLSAERQTLFYRSSGASRRIARILSEVDLADIRKKKFWDCNALCQMNQNLP